MTPLLHSSNLMQQSLKMCLQLMTAAVKLARQPLGKIFQTAMLIFVLASASLPARAQLAVPPPTPAYQPLPAQQLDQLLGPIALYPDPLIAIILPASTFPTDIVLADRYLSGGGDPNATDQQPWDASVQALAHYPNVLQWMDQNLEWTTELGQAFLNQQQDVMDSIQRLRTEAYNLGNLQSTPQQQIVNDGGDIEILPAEPQVIYVPVYQPDDVYDQAGFGLSFGIGFPIGVWLNCDFDWHHHHLMVWNRDHPRPANWWHERPTQRAAAFVGATTVWHPVNRPGFITANRGDRGWNNPVVRSTAPVANRPAMRPFQPRNVPNINLSRPGLRPVVNRPAPAPVQQYEPITRPPSNGAFIGIQSAQQTRDYSNRGRQSMQTFSHSAPPTRSAPFTRSVPSRPAMPFQGGGGGGGHAPNQQRR